MGESREVTSSQLELADSFRFTWEVSALPSPWCHLVSSPQLLFEGVRAP